MWQRDTRRTSIRVAIRASRGPEREYEGWAQIVHNGSRPHWDYCEGAKHVAMDSGCGDGVGDWLR